MLIIVVICILAIFFAYEIRHRMISEQLTYLNNEAHRLSSEIKTLKEELAKKQDTEAKKNFKLPFFP